MKLLLFSYRLILILLFYGDRHSIPECKNTKRALQRFCYKAQISLSGGSFHQDGAAPYASLYILEKCDRFLKPTSKQASVTFFFPDLIKS